MIQCRSGWKISRVSRVDVEVDDEAGDEADDEADDETDH